MPHKMTGEEEAAFWYGLDQEMGEKLGLGVQPPGVWLEDMG